MITIPRQDHELFKVLNSRREGVEKAVAALSGRKKRGEMRLNWERMTRKIRYYYSTLKFKVVGALGALPAQRRIF